MAPAYKVEELLALRDSVSESAVSLDKFKDEDVIKGTFVWLAHANQQALESICVTTLVAILFTASVVGSHYFPLTTTLTLSTLSI